MTIKQIHLSEEQMKHLDSIRWLLAGPRAVGRTYLLAVVYIEIALKSINQWVIIRDHTPHRHADRNLISLIKSIVEDIDGIDVEIKIDSYPTQFRLKYDISGDNT